MREELNRQVHITHEMERTVLDLKRDVKQLEHDLRYERQRSEAAERFYRKQLKVKPEDVGNTASTKDRSVEVATQRIQALEKQFKVVVSALLGDEAHYPVRSPTHLTTALQKSLKAQLQQLSHNEYADLSDRISTLQRSVSFQRERLLYKGAEDEESIHGHRGQ